MKHFYNFSFVRSSQHIGFRITNGNPHTGGIHYPPLNISKEEIQQLSTIKLSKEERREEKREGKAKKQKRAKELKERGKTITEIAKTLKISRKTVYSYLQRISGD